MSCLASISHGTKFLPYLPHLTLTLILILILVINNFPILVSLFSHSTRVLLHSHEWCI